MWDGRRALIGAATVALVVAGFATVSIGAAWAVAPAVRVTPNTNLADGQKVGVQAAGFPNADLEFLECNTVYGCDANTGQFVFPGSSGRASTSYYVSRIIRPSGKTVDCAHTGHCILVGVAFPNTSTSASWPITFDPNKPIQPPLAVSMSLDGSDGVVVSSGVAVLHGNVTCNRAATLSMFADVTQATSGTVSESYGNTELACTTAQTIRWQLSVNPQSQFFATGPAQVRVNARATANRSFASANASGTVILGSANLPTLIPSGAHVTVPAAGSTVVLHYWVLLSAPSQFPVSFAYSTLNGSASAPADYASTSGFVTMPAGATKAIVPITINGNNESPGHRTFIVSITSPSNAALGANHGRGTVTLIHN